MRRLSTSAWRGLSLHNWRARRHERRRFDQFAARCRHLRPAPRTGQGGPGEGAPALIVGHNFTEARGIWTFTEILRDAGYVPAVLVFETRHQALRPYYESAGVREFIAWSTPQPEAYTDEARAWLQQCASFADLLRADHRGVRIGRAALSSLLRESQTGLHDIDLPGPDPRLIRTLAVALASADAASDLMQRLKPGLTLSYEMEYSPRRELFDATLASGGAVVMAARAPHRDDFMVKRYATRDGHAHPTAPSEATWQHLRDMPWDAARRRALEDAIAQSYRGDDWWGVPTIALDRAEPPDSLRRRLGLDPGRKTAVIFPHVPWDASFCWGTDLFGDYQTWLLEILRAACSNPRVNWVVRIHPANVLKSRAMSAGGDPVELASIRQQLGTLPPHITVLPADAPVATPALLGIADYCLTVRGTVGLEAASLGIPVLTAGTGRYDRRGFTVDSGSPAELLDRVRAIDDLPPLTAPQRELAQRFAYGMFVLRPVPLMPALGRSLSGEISSIDDAIRRDPCLRAFREWLRTPAGEDFLVSDSAC